MMTLMTKNITLRLDESLLKRCRTIAVESDKSLSRWVADLLVENLSRQADWNKTKRKALGHLEYPPKLRAGRAKRDALYDR